MDFKKEVIIYRYYLFPLPVYDMMKNAIDNKSIEKKRDNKILNK
jgi:hypothetical protein